MQTKNSSNYQELKVSICRNFLKNKCPYGKDCKFRHPTKPLTKENEVCLYYLRNTCKRGSECPFLHMKPQMEAEVCKYFLQNKCKRGNECPYLHRNPVHDKRQRMDWLTFCPYFPSGQCKNKDCRFLHIAEDEKNIFRTTGKIVPQVLEQAKCKALLQEASLDGNTPTCKDFLQGSCEWMSCPFLHLTRQEFSQTILGILTEKFEAILGSHEGHHLHSKNLYVPSSRYQEYPGIDLVPPFKDSNIPKRYLLDGDKSYGMGYGKKSSWYGEPMEHDQQEFISSETDHIIKGIYSLMKRDTEKQEITDLREKLNRLAEENARYKFEFSRIYEGDGYQPLMPMAFSATDDFKYQDAMRRLERENVEMRRQLSVMQEREQKPLLGRLGGPQHKPKRGISSSQSHHPIDKRIYGLPKAGANQGQIFNPLKYKVNNQLKHNMLQQYKKPLSLKQGAVQQGKGNHQKYQKPSKKNPQQSQKAPSGPKSNQKKKEQSQSAKSADSKNSVKIEPSKDNQESGESKDNKESGESSNEGKESVESSKKDTELGEMSKEDKELDKEDRESESGNDDKDSGSKDELASCGSEEESKNTEDCSEGEDSRALETEESKDSEKDHQSEEEEVSREETTEDSVCEQEESSSSTGDGDMRKSPSCEEEESGNIVNGEDAGNRKKEKLDTTSEGTDVRGNENKQKENGE